MTRGIWIRNPFCPKGHDKRLPHGTYIRTKNGRIYLSCAECDRNRHKKETK